MKKIILILILLIGVGFLVINYRTTPQDIELATVADISEVDNTDQIYQNFVSDDYAYELTAFDFKFTGYGPAGKQHLGEISSTIDNGDQVYFDMTSVTTDSEQLDAHLCTDDFFSCEEYPNSFFVLEGINPISPDTARVFGTYELKGIKKSISFVADTIENLSPENLSADYTGRFMLDTTEFNFKVPIVDSNVLIEFNFSVLATEIEKEATDETATSTSATTTVSTTTEN
jgi:hypothetical protein